MARIQSVDAFRVLAIAAVIALHTAPHTGPDAVGLRFDTRTLCDQLERFAVPLFFILSGYFWAGRCRDGAGCWTAGLALARRVYLLFVVWSVIYFLVNVAEAAWSADSLATGLRAAARPLPGLPTLLLQGTKVHLWFLPALALAALVSGALLARRMERTLLVLALLLYGVGLAGKAYADTPFGFHTHVNVRNGLCFSLLMFASGVWLRRLGPAPAWRWLGPALALGGLALQLVELAWLHARWGTNMAQDFVVGTYFYGLGVAMLALSDPAPLRFPRLAGLGPLVLGIYASHNLFVDPLAGPDNPMHALPGWDIIVVAVVFVLSLALTGLLARFPLTRRFVA
ncbi:acyltransferase [Massilia putida]|uniref:acyltransferase n=1 Tax=Massilia putida TaxID=1141883 RepID=UPI0009515F6D|nr:acyltransferase family protein [Massilia putida]